MDFNQLYFLSGYLKEGIEPTARDNLVEKAHDADGIATDGNEIVILSPHQHNFNMQLTVELWENKPEDDLELWQEAFAANIVIVEDTFIYSSVTYDEEREFEIPSGYYNLLIAGRDFVGCGWAESTCPGDKWRVQLWSTQEPAKCRRLKKWMA